MYVEQLKYRSVFQSKKNASDANPFRYECFRSWALNGKMMEISQVIIIKLSTEPRGKWNKPQPQSLKSIYTANNG